MQKASIFLGLNDKDSKLQKIETAAAVEMLKASLLRYFVGASIIPNVIGIFKHDDGILVTENSILTIIYGYDRAAVLHFIEDLKKEFNQESITLEYYESAPVEFI